MILCLNVWTVYINVGVYLSNMDAETMYTVFFSY